MPIGVDTAIDTKTIYKVLNIIGNIPPSPDAE